MSPVVEKEIINQVKKDVNQGYQANPIDQKGKPFLFSTEQSNPSGSSLTDHFSPDLDGLIGLLDKLDQFGEEKFFIEICEDWTSILNL